MITKSMTIEELRKNIGIDMQYIMRYLDARENKYYRAVIKTKKFPLFFPPVFYKSPSKNEWVINIETRSKAETSSDMSRVTFACLMRNENGIYVILPTWINEKLHVITFAPHFFSRYAERYGSIKTGKELIAEYLKYNNSYVYNSTPRTENGVSYDDVAGVTKHGVALGISVTGGVFFKTFITYDMLKGEQIETYIRSEQYRQEMHE